MEPHTILSKEGYLLNKRNYDEVYLSNIRKELTVSPMATYKVSAKTKPEKFIIYDETDDYISVPKFYGLERFGEPEVNEELKGKKIKFKTSINLRDYQEEIVDTTYKQIKEVGGGGICVGCGKGKTIMAIKIIEMVKRKTLIMVHKTFLLDQWIDRITGVCPDAKIGIIMQDKIDIEDKDIVIGMLQSIAKDKYDRDVFMDFGFVVFDEAHHAPSKYFSRALPIISCRKSLFLTATPKRSDGTEYVLYWYFGPVAYLLPPDKNDNVIVKSINYTVEDDKFREYKVRFTGQVNKAKTITSLGEVKKRNKFIIKLITECLIEEGRKILVLSDRIDHLKRLEKKLKKRDIDYGYYIGGMKRNKLEESEKKTVILASYGMASEGLDIPALNTLILATPRRNIEQSVGRILRKQHKNVQPLIYDIVDNLTSCVNQGEARFKFFRKLDFELYRVKVLENEVISEEMIERKCKKNREKEEVEVDDIELDMDNLELLYDSDD